MTRYFLDRDVLGAVESPRGNRSVRAWIDTVRDDDLFISVVTVMEARKGFACLRERTLGRAAEIAELEVDFDILLTAFADRRFPSTARWRIVGARCWRGVTPTSWTLP